MLTERKRKAEDDLLKNQSKRMRLSENQEKQDLSENQHDPEAEDDDSDNENGSESESSSSGEEDDQPVASLRQSNAHEMVITEVHNAEFF